MQQQKQIQAGKDTCTWDSIYLGRKNGYGIPQTQDSSLIIEYLIRHKRMPAYSTHNLTSSSSPFMELNAEDEGNFILVSMRLSKSSNIKEGMCFLGDNLQSYSCRHQYEANENDLLLAIDNTRISSLAIGRNPRAKRLTNLDRAFGLWILDFVQRESASFIVAFNGLVLFVNKVDGTKEIVTKDQRSFERYYKNACDSIMAGKALPLSAD
ncbi:hypothetical protein [Desulfolutivibrio sulfoxidireducens]|uniref:hypothetical protein n=1 Tax=Desulfolutivibrio sulfoxidireducens TaxID=2773299 RepID=UPI00159D0A62|nr:hypothetical protein [Desulfolutivibrio sulfoxidireducens]QLA16375.1 hypothetical protein GD605_09710 [Desulfolutivibrio sulfoxidireducens]